jgi:hypothetical protein
MFTTTFAYKSVLLQMTHAAIAAVAIVAMVSMVARFAVAVVARVHISVFSS